MDDPWGQWQESVQGVTWPDGGFVHACSAEEAGCQYGIDLCVSGYTVESAQRASLEALLRFPWRGEFDGDLPTWVSVHLRWPRKDGSRHPARPMRCRCRWERDAEGNHVTLKPTLLFEESVPEGGRQSREHTAQHEAGHHIAALTMGADICSVTLAPEDAREGSLGTVRHRLPWHVQGAERDRIRAIVSLAGPEAGRRVHGDSLLVALMGESHTDMESALLAVGVRGFLCAWQEASTLLDRHWRAVEAVRDLLLRRGESEWHDFNEAAFRADRDLEKVFWEAKDGGPQPWHEEMRVSDHDEPEE